MAFSLVQEVHDFSGSTSQPTLTYSSNVTQGNLLVAWVSASSANVVTINGGHRTVNWIPIGTTLTAGYGVLTAWYCIATKTGPLSVKFFNNTMISAGEGGIPASLPAQNCQLMEFAGGGLNPFETSGTATGTSTAPAKALTVSGTADLIIGLAISATSQSSIETAGWTNAAGANVPFSAIYAVETGAGTFTPTFLQNASAAWGCIAIAFKAPGTLRTISGNLGVLGAGSKVYFISTTTSLLYSAIANGSSNYTSPSLPDDTYVVIPQLVGKIFNPVSNTNVVINGANVTSINFTAASIATNVAFVTTATDTFTRANESPLNPSFWSINGTPSPPWDPGIQVLSNKGAMTTGTIINTEAAPFNADGVQIYTGVVFANDQWEEIEIDTLSSSQFSYASVMFGIRSTAQDTSLFRVQVTNNGDGTCVIQLLTFTRDGLVHPVNVGNLTPAHNSPYAYWLIPDLPFSLGDKFKIAAVGSNIYLYQNSILIGTFADTSLTSGDIILELTGNAVSDAQISNFSAGSASLPFVPNTFTQLAIDTFTRANENPLNVTNWSQNTAPLAPLQIVSNACEATSANNSNTQIRTGTWPADQYADATVGVLTGASTDIQPQVRSSTSAQTCYLGQVKGPIGASTAVKLFSVVAGVFNQLGTTQTLNVVAGDVFRTVVAGTAVSLLQNGTTVIGPITDSTLATGKPGLEISPAAALTNVTVTNFTAGAVNATSSASAGTPQSATVSTAFGTQLAVTVLDSSGAALPGVSVVFLAPASSASGTFATGGTNTQTVVTNASGIAQASVFSANSTAGGPYNVTGTANGLAAVNFVLTNTSAGGAGVTGWMGRERRFINKRG